MAAVGQIDDWLMTPGIAYTSVKAMQTWSQEKRWRTSVMLGFDGTERGKKMKENHTRLMNNLCDLYRKMKGESPVEQERSGNLPDMPSFGTHNTFCDKSGRPVTPTPVPTPVPTAQPALQQQSIIPNVAETTHSSKPFQGFGVINEARPSQPQQPIVSASIPNVTEMTEKSKPFQGFYGINEQQAQFVLPITPSDASNEAPKAFRGDDEMNKDQQSFPLESPTAILDAPKTREEKPFTGFGLSLSDYESWSGGYSRVAESRDTTANWDDAVSQQSVHTQDSKATRHIDMPAGGMSSRHSTKSLQSMEGSYDCSTPNAANMEAGEICMCPETPPPKGTRKERERPKIVEPEARKEGEEEEDPKSRLVPFDTLPADGERAGCPYTVEQEKVRNYDREPVAAGERYLKQMDRLENNLLVRLQKEVKFDRRRTKKWVARFQAHPPVSDARMDVYDRYRCHEDPLDAALFDREDVLIPETVQPDPAEEAEERQRAEVDGAFAQMIDWVRGKCGVAWAREDSGRVAFPQKDSLVSVRVVGVAGRRAIVCPAHCFADLADTLKAHVDTAQPTRLAHAILNDYAVVLVEQEEECDVINECQYRRGWVFDGAADAVSVLLMDERRIVRVPHSQLYACPPDLLSCSLPPLCVTAELDREVMEHELPLLLQVGCSVLCRVEGGGGEEPLKLSLVRIDTEGRSLDVFFCSEECAGACEYHRNEQQ